MIESGLESTKAFPATRQALCKFRTLGGKDGRFKSRSIEPCGSMEIFDRTINQTKGKTMSCNAK
jgi:hypothetical protein